MALTFRSLRSSSSGNCLLLQSERTAILLDCGLKTQGEIHALLDEHAPRVDGAVISHIHSDHINYSSLRALARRGVAIHTHAQVIGELGHRHECHEWTQRPVFCPFAAEAFCIGDFELTPIEVPHDPACTNYGFVIRHQSGVKVVVCTDFHHYADVLRHFLDADFIFVEANHDPQLLRIRPNYASRFHMSNVKTAWLLYHAMAQSRMWPEVVMLGHLSRQRNTPQLAMDAVAEVFGRQRAAMKFELRAAPAFSPSEVVAIRPRGQEIKGATQSTAFVGEQLLLPV